MNFEVIRHKGRLSDDNPTTLLNNTSESDTIAFDLSIERYLNSSLLKPDEEIINTNIKVQSIWADGPDKDTFNHPRTDDVDIDESKFGYSVSIHNGFCAIGAPYMKNENNEFDPRGAVYLFQYNNDSEKWERIHTFTGSEFQTELENDSRYSHINTPQVGKFGTKVLLTDDVLLVADPLFANNIGDLYQGIVAVYVRQQIEGNPWVLNDVLSNPADASSSSAPGSYNYFGGAMDVDHANKRVVIGGRNPFQTIIRLGDSTFDESVAGTIIGRTKIRSVHVYQIDYWLNITKIKSLDNPSPASDTSTTLEDNYGSTVAIDGDSILVGSPLDDIARIDYGSISPKPGAPMFTYRGKVYYFARDPSTTQWSLSNEILPSADISEQRVIFGTSVNLRGGTALIKGIKYPENDEYIYTYKYMDSMVPPWNMFSEVPTNNNPYIDVKMINDSSFLVAHYPKEDNSTQKVDKWTMNQDPDDPLIINWSVTDTYDGSNIGFVGAGNKFGGSVDVDLDNNIIVGVGDSISPYISQNNGAIILSPQDSLCYVTKNNQTIYQMNEDNDKINITDKIVLSKNESLNVYQNNKYCTTVEYTIIGSAVNNNG